jgi:UPF0755 protein
MLIGDEGLSRLVRVLVALAFAAALIALLCVGIVVVGTGGNPVDAIQTELIRLSLAGREAELNAPAGNDPDPVRFTVASGDSPRAIAAKLVDARLISDAELFVGYVRVHDLDTELEAGTYFIRQTQTIPEIAAALTDSRNSVINFVILEGWRMEEIAEAVDRDPLFAFTGADFLRAVGRGVLLSGGFAAQVGLPDGASLEGFLFPNTYQLPPDISAEGLRDLLLEEFLRQVGAGALVQAAQQNRTLYQVVTLASIVQREAVHPEEHPQIAGVYLNRLNVGMRLDADPTVQYPLGEPGNWWKQITQADYQGVVSPYNTYRVTGLPPGPIANPGLAAINGVLNPTPSDYFYFQADCGGSGYHNFSETYEEHLAKSC